MPPAGADPAGRGLARRGLLVAALSLLSVVASTVGPHLVTGTSAAFTDRASTTGRVTVKAACSPTNPFPAAVLALGPTFYWRFGEAAGASSVADATGNGNAGLVRTSSPTAGVAAPLTFAAPGSGLVFCDGRGLTSPDTPAGASSGSFVTWPTRQPNTNAFTLVVWVRTSTTTGGRIMGMSSSTWAKSVHYDRQLWLDDTGRAVFGVYPGATRWIRSPQPVNDGQPHLLVASLGGAGMRLYVDGSLVATNGSVTTAETYTTNETVNPTGSPPPNPRTPDGFGYWRVGWDNLNSWGSVQPSSFGLAGTIDEAALVGRQISDSQVSDLWQSNHW